MGRDEDRRDGDRKAALAAALRANLRRRKAAAPPPPIPEALQEKDDEPADRR